MAPAFCAPRCAGVDINLAQTLRGRRDYVEDFLAKGAYARKLVRWLSARFGAASILAAWAEQTAVREIMVFLHSHGVGTARAVRIFKPTR
jgi:hypothetical protein